MDSWDGESSIVSCESPPRGRCGRGGGGSLRIIFFRGGYLDEGFGESVSLVVFGGGCRRVGGDGADWRWRCVFGKCGKCLRVETECFCPNRECGGIQVVVLSTLIV